MNRILPSLLREYRRSHGSESICWVVVTASRPTLSRAAEDLYLEWKAFRIVVGVTGAAVAAGTGRERNQQIDLGEEFDEIAGANGARFHEVLMRVARVASAHEYVHHIMNMNLGIFERQIPFCREGPGQIRVTAVVVLGPLQ
jgi:hypothetical protein